MPTSYYYLIAAYVITFAAMIGYHLYVRAKADRLESERRDLQSRLTEEAPGKGVGSSS